MSGARKPALMASPPSQSTLSRPIGFDQGEGFTPGPWVACRPMVGTNTWEIEHGQPRIGDIAYLSLNPERLEANARLIAAAPDLYAACESAIPTGVCLTNRNIPDSFAVALDCTMGDLRKIAAALAKARGEA